MSLVRFSEVVLSFGHQVLLDGINLTIEKGQHLGLIGRNGEGKSSLLKLLNQEIQQDKGEIQFQRGLCVRRLEQTVPDSSNETVLEKVAAGLGELGESLIAYQKLLLEPSRSVSDEARLHKLQEWLDHQNAWGQLSKIESLLSKMSLNAMQALSELSGGMRRRVLLAECLVTEPDLLLLDEPTNHLDIESIKWLEKFLASYQGTYILVTHDRAFLKALTDTILEIDRGRVRYFACGYEKYEQKKAELLEIEEKENNEFDKKLALEEKWIRQGIKARRTRNEGRVRKLKALREVRKNRREQIGQMNLSSADIERSGKLVFEASGLCFSREGKNIIQSFSALVANGDKIGLVGPNGCGKTTLLKLLLEQLKPDSGTLKLGSKLKVAYFDQMRTGFAEEKSAIDNVGQGSQTVNIFGEEKHVIGYLQQFLFSPDRARSPVKYLSGGEKNRLYLASLFTKNANLLVLDEPTNDLDIESLEVLEAFLVDYPGTVLIVSHDRVFLENVVTTSWVYQGKGQFKEEVGAVHQYVHNEKPIDLLTGPKEKKAKELHESKPSNSLSQEDRKNLNRVTKKIDKLEAHIDELKIQLAEPSLYQAENNQDYLSLSKTLEEAEMALEALYEEWEALESKQ